MLYYIPYIGMTWAVLSVFALSNGIPPHLFKKGRHFYKWRVGMWNLCLSILAGMASFAYLSIVLLLK